MCVRIRGANNKIEGEKKWREENGEREGGREGGGTDGWRKGDKREKIWIHMYTD